MQKAIFMLAAALVLTLHLSAQAKLKVLHNFGSASDGSAPSGPLAFDSRGNLYGLTAGGGQDGFGSVFELTPQKNATWREQILYSFKGGSDGEGPEGNVALGVTETLYGTLYDTTVGTGAVFELKRSGGNWANNILYTDGAGPGLLPDKFGDLYGGIGHGNGVYGAIGELSPGSSGWSYAALYDFCATSCTGGDDLLAPPFGTTTAISGA